MICINVKTNYWFFMEGLMQELLDGAVVICSIIVSQYLAWGGINLIKESL